jgi:hypothetical protein
VTDEDPIVEHAAGLHKALTRGQITMMGLGRPDLRREKPSVPQAGNEDRLQPTIGRRELVGLVNLIAFLRTLSASRSKLTVNLL